MPATEDEQIHHLQSLVNQLKKALHRIDSDVRHAAKKYVREVPEGHLHFSDFIALLVREIRQEIKRELCYEGKMLLTVKKAVRELAAERIEELAIQNLPAFSGEIEDYVKLPVLLVRSKDGKLPCENESMSVHYRAISVRGEKLKQGHGKTQEGAWEDLRERIALELLKRDSPLKLVSFLATNQPLIEERFKLAAPWKTEEIGGFKVEIRMEDKT